MTDEALGLLAAMDASCVSVGHSRDAGSAARAHAFVEAWSATGRDVAVVVDWPDAAASWLRQARALIAPSPDALLLTGPLATMRRVNARLATWDPARTVVIAAVGDGIVVGLADSVC